MQVRYKHDMMRDAKVALTIWRVVLAFCALVLVALIWLSISSRSWNVAFMTAFFAAGVWVMFGRAWWSLEPTARRRWPEVALVVEDDGLRYWSYDGREGFSAWDEVTRVQLTVVIRVFEGRHRRFEAYLLHLESFEAQELIDEVHRRSGGRVTVTVRA